MLKSISQRALRKTSRIPAAIILTLLLIGGCAGVYAWTIKSYRQFQDAKNWLETPCRIKSSTVGVHHGEDGPTYSIDILYEYTYKGITYISARYNFAPGGSSSGYESKEAVVKQYPPGKETVCYVNPEMPSQAVLDRNFTLGMLVTLLPAIPALIGAVGLTFLIRSGRKPPPKTIYDTTASYNAGTAGTVAVPDSIPRGPVILRPKESRMGKVIAILVFSTIWDALLLVFIFAFLRDESFSRFRLLFFIPFIIAAIAMFIALVVQVVSLTNPKVIITVGSAAIPLGGTLDVKWEIPEKANTLRRLIIQFEGSEEATYSSGKNTHTDKNVFMQIPIVETSEHSAMARGSTEIKIPQDTMHSFKASQNKILWNLNVVGEFPRWFRMKQNYEITVLPLEG